MGPRIREDRRGGKLFGGKNWGWFETSPYEGLVAQYIRGDHKGRPYRGWMAG